MRIEIIQAPIRLEEAREIGSEFYTDMVKGACDIKKGIMALGGEYHIDSANVLAKNGSLGTDIWGFNIIFGRKPEDALEYTSLINIRPDLGNRGMDIADKLIRSRIKEVIEKKIIW